MAARDGSRGTRPPLHRENGQRMRPVPRRGWGHARYGDAPEQPTAIEACDRDYAAWRRERLAAHDENYRRWRDARGRELDAHYRAYCRRNRTFSEKNDAVTTGDERP